MRRLLALIVLTLAATTSLSAGELTIDLGPRAEAVTLVGAINRLDADGLLRTPVDPKAHIGAPPVDAQATLLSPGKWKFAELPPGHYDLVVIALKARIRVEGFRYPPVAEFDPVFPPSSTPPDEEDRTTILDDIRQSRHYENKVVPLFLGGNPKGDQVRILMQLVRDKDTSYDADYGAPVATVRHEVWQYDLRYGSWSKQRKTVVLDRVILPRADFARWTWVWHPQLGDIEVKDKSVTLSFPWPERFEAATSRGWFPNSP